MLPDLKFLPRPLRIALFCGLMLILSAGLVFSIANFSYWMDCIESWLYTLP